MQLNHIQQALQLASKPKIQLPTTNHVQTLLQSLHQKVDDPCTKWTEELIVKLTSNSLPYCHESVALNQCKITTPEYLRKTLFGSYNYFDHDGYHIYTNNKLSYFKAKGEGSGFYSLLNYSTLDILKMFSECEKLQRNVIELQHLSHNKSNQINYQNSKLEAQEEEIREQKKTIKKLMKQTQKQRHTISMGQTKITKFRRSKNYFQNESECIKYEREELVLKNLKEMTASIYRTGLNLSFMNTSNIIAIIFKYLNINVKAPSKSKVSNMVHEHIESTRKSWQLALDGKYCTLSFDIASADSFSYLQIISSIPQFNPNTLRSIESHPQIHINGFSFELVREFQAVDLIQYSSELIELKSKKASDVLAAVTNYIDELKLHPMFFITDGGAENVGCKKGAATLLQQNHGGANIVCSAHRLHLAFERGFDMFSDNIQPTIDWVIRFVRNNWSKQDENIPKPKLVMKTRWLTHIKGAELFTFHFTKFEFSPLKSTTQKSKVVNSN